MLKSRQSSIFNIPFRTPISCGCINLKLKIFHQVSLYKLQAIPHKVVANIELKYSFEILNL